MGLYCTLYPNVGARSTQEKFILGASYVLQRKLINQLIKIELKSHSHTSFLNQQKRTIIEALLYSHVNHKINLIEGTAGALR